MNFDPIEIQHPEPEPDVAPTFVITRNEVQEWVDALDDRHQAYLRWLMTRAAFHGEIAAMAQCATFAGLVSNQLTADHKEAPARGARDVAGGLMKARLNRIQQGEREGLE